MKVAKFAIFLTGMMGLVMGGLMTITSLKHQQDQVQLRQMEQLKSEAQILVDQFYAAVESVKSIANQSTTGNIAGLASLPYVSHVGTLKLHQQVPSEFESLARQDEIQLGAGKDGKAVEPLPELLLEERVLKALQKSFSFSDFQISKFAMTTYPTAENSHRESMVLATPIYKIIQGVADPTQIEKMTVVLVDPIRVMASLGKRVSDTKKSFLINQNGKVLAHTQESFIGTELKKIESLVEKIENLFLGAQTGVVTPWVNPQGKRDLIAFVRAGIYPFAVATQEEIAAPVLSAGWLSQQMSSGAARKNLGTIFVLIAISLILFAWIQNRAVRTWLSQNDGASSSPARENVQTDSSRLDLTNSLSAPVTTSFQRWAVGAPTTPAEILNQAPPPAPATAPAPTTAESSTKPIRESAQESAQEATEQFVQSQKQIQDENRQFAQKTKQIVMSRNFEREFMDRIKNQYTIETIETELVSISSELTESPVLYFRYHRQTQSLSLAAVAGDIVIPNYALMQAYVRKDIEQQVERLANQGKVASVSNYGPISKLMLLNLNVAHFEAWVVNSDAEISGNARMLGVLVILQAGFRSAQTRPVLANILKEAGNALSAQTSKIRPRRYPESPVQT